MPVAYVGHGNPMNVVMPAMYQPWREWGKRLLRPRAILAVSAHWEDEPVTIGRTGNHDELFYDFYGFPDFMYQLQYPAPGAPDLADRVEQRLEGSVAVERSDRPLDHGAWVPLLHLYPAANVPVLEISMPLSMSEADLYQLGAELSPLRDEGVLILATGNLVHNLRAADWSGQMKEPPAFAAHFDDWVKTALHKADHTALQDWRSAAPGPLQSHPSAEHYRPILVAAGAAGSDEVRFPVEGFEMASIARRSVQFA
jgi:4,5-DOPA dioxygenase extradiol